MDPDATRRTHLKRSLSCSLDSTTVGSPIVSSGSCSMSWSSAKELSTFSGSLLSPSSSSEILSAVHQRHPSSGCTPIGDSYKPASCGLNSPAAAFSSCMFPEIPAFSPDDSALPGSSATSDSAYVAAEEAELTPVGGIGGGESGDDGRSSVTISLKRSYSGTFRDGDAIVKATASKTPCSDNGHQRIKTAGAITVY